LTSAVTPYIARQGGLHRRRDTLDFFYSVVVWIAPASYWVYVASIRSLFPQYNGIVQVLIYFIACLPFSILVRSRIVAFSIALGKEADLLQFAFPSLVVSTIIILLNYLVNPTISGVAIGWMVSVLLTGIIGGIFSARRFSVPGTAIVYSSTYNSIGATVVFLFCASNSGYISSVLYGFCALLATGINYRRYRQVQT
jgi:hypothetical protein